MRIYTKNGDEGFSCVYSGERVSKASAVFDILGQIDAINSSIGYLKCCLKQNRTSYQTCGTFLELLQQELIVISSDLSHYYPYDQALVLDHQQLVCRWQRCQEDQVREVEPWERLNQLPASRAHLLVWGW